MESPCRLGVLLLCLSMIVNCETSFSSEIRDWMGLTSPTSKGSPGAVIVFINNEAAISADNALDDGDLLNLAADLEQRDPSAIYVHFDGDNLITSQASLFQNFDSQNGNSNWSALLDKVKDHRKLKESSYSDLLVFQSHPEELQEDADLFCNGGIYAESQKCRVVTAFLNDDASHSRYRRATADLTTPSPSPMTPAQRANIPADSVAAFHLLFWTCLAIALTVFGTAYGMWHMDPGRDSIIYRMTSAQKFKKDK